MKRYENRQTAEALKELESTGEEDSWAEVLKDKLARETSFRFKTTGHSMYPFIREGDSVVVTSLRSKKIHLGDIVAMVHPTSGRLFIHRIIGKDGTYVITKGDNGACADGRIPGQFIFGSVTGIERNGKRLCLGLGPERALIALLSRKEWLHPLFWLLRSLFARRSSRWA